MPIVPIAGAWQKFLVQSGVEIAGAVAAYLLSGLTEGTEDTDPETLEWMHWTMEYARTTPSGTNEDRAQFSMDILNLTGGVPDATYTSGDFTTIINAIGVLEVALRPYQQPSHGGVRVTAHRRRFNPAGWPAKRFQPSGAPIYSLDQSFVAGTGTNGAYQVAATVTERTALPSHWGRMFVPGLSSGALDTNGRITSTARNAIRDAFATCFATLRAADFYVVVPVTQHDKAPAFGLLSVSQLAVDDIPDVQRRRRPKQVAARSTT